MTRPPGVLPPDLLLRLHERHPGRYPVLLESVGDDARLGRYDLLFALPGARLELRHRPRQRAVVGEDAVDESVQTRRLTGLVKRRDGARRLQPA